MDPSKDEVGWLLEKICMDKNGQFVMIPILFPPLIEEIFEQIYTVFVRSFATDAKERYPKRNFSLIGLDENPLAIIQNNFNFITKLANYFDLKLEVKAISEWFIGDDTEKRRTMEENLKKQGISLEKEMTALEDMTKNKYERFKETVRVDNDSNYLPLSDQPMNSFDENSFISRLYAYFLNTELGGAIMIRTFIAGSIFAIIRTTWTRKILKELHLHRFRLHELRIRKDDNQRYFAEMKHFNIRQTKNPMENFDRAIMEKSHSIKSKLIQQRSLKARIPITSSNAEIGWTSFKASTASGWTKFNYREPITKSSVSLEDLVVDKPTQEFLEALEYARGKYVHRDPKTKTERLKIRDTNIESLRHIYLQRLIIDFADVFDLIDEIENEFLEEMRIFASKVRKNRDLLSRINSRSILGQILTSRKATKALNTSDSTTKELTVSEKPAIADQSVEARAMYGINPVKETLRNRSGSVVSTMIAREREFMKYKRHKRRFKYDMYFDSLADSLDDQQWKTELIELLALHPEITNHDIQLIKSTRNIFDAQMQLKIILFNLSDAVYDSENWKSLRTPDITTHYCTLKLMNNSLDHQDLLILDQIVENCKKYGIKKAS